jgi:predicted phosphodiesterase
MRQKRRSDPTILRIILATAVLASLSLIGALFLSGKLPLQTAAPSPSPPPPTLTPAPIPTNTASPTVVLNTPTLTPSPTETEVRYTFAVCGDSRGGDEIYREILRRVEKDGAAFFVNTGDLVLRGLESEFVHFAELMADFALPFYPVAGNHDAAGADLSSFLKYSGAPSVHYSFEHGNGHFIIVDSHGGGVNTPELTWLEGELSAVDKPLTFVFLHHPPYDPDGTDYTMQWGNDRFMHLMEEYDVDIVFAGHIHAYVEGERGGVRYIITGGGGAPLYGGEHPQAFHHYVRVEVQGTQVSTQVVKVGISQ